MYEYGLINISTGERNVIYGYSVKDAFSRSHLVSTEWDVDYVEHID